MVTVRPVHFCVLAPHMGLTQDVGASVPWTCVWKCPIPHCPQGLDEQEQQSRDGWTVATWIPWAPKGLSSTVTLCHQRDSEASDQSLYTF